MRRFPDSAAPDDETEPDLIEGHEEQEGAVHCRPAARPPAQLGDADEGHVDRELDDWIAIQWDFMPENRSLKSSRIPVRIIYRQQV